MGLIDKIKSAILIARMKRKLKKKMKESQGKEIQSLAMTTDELSLLSDDDLFFAVLERTEKIVDSFESCEDGIASLNNSQKIFYSLNWYESEINNGGLCQFFVNSSRIVAPYISEYLEMVFADEHKELFDNFIKDNGIDLSNLSFFDIKEIEEFDKKYQAYPFENFDSAYYNNEPIEAYLKIFARENLKDF